MWRKVLTLHVKLWMHIDLPLTKGHLTKNSHNLLSNGASLLGGKGTTYCNFSWNVACFRYVLSPHYTDLTEVRVCTSLITPYDTMRNPTGFQMILFLLPVIESWLAMLQSRSPGWKWYWVYICTDKLGHLLKAVIKIHVGVCFDFPFFRVWRG